MKVTGNIARGEYGYSSSYNITVMSVWQVSAGHFWCSGMERFQDASRQLALAPRCPASGASARVLETGVLCRVPYGRGSGARAGRRPRQLRSCCHWQRSLPGDTGLPPQGEAQGRPSGRASRFSSRVPSSPVPGCRPCPSRRALRKQLLLLLGSGQRCLAHGPHRAEALF